MRRVLVLLMACAVGLCATGAVAQSGGADRQARQKPASPANAARTARASSAVRLGRVVVRWHSRETGGVGEPQFILARELAFEARLEALAEGISPQVGYQDKHVRTALQRHITETMLARLPIQPAPTPTQVAEYADVARQILVQRVGGPEPLGKAAKAEGIDSDYLDAITRRQARASWYLDRMVAPMLEPTETDLREVHRNGDTPFTDRRFEQVADELERWWVATRLAAALERYFRNARARVTVRVIGAR